MANRKLLTSFRDRFCCRCVQFRCSPQEVTVDNLSDTRNRITGQGNDRKTMK